MNFIPRLNSDGMYNSQWWYSTGNPFYDTPNHMYGLPNCTCYAYGRYAEIRHQLKNLGFANLPTGDAKDWYNDPVTVANFRRGNTPELGAVVCYAPTDSSSSYAGHVAIVESIEDDVVITSNSYYGGVTFATETVYAANNYTPQWAINKGYALQGFIYNDAVSGGYSDYVIAAIAGNWTVESVVNPGAWEGYVQGAFNQQGIGYGLGQWTNTNTNYGRLWNLRWYAEQNNLDVSDGNTQLAFFVSENPVDSWDSTDSDYSSLDNFLNSTSTNVNELTKEFMDHWERVVNDTLPLRQQYANTLYSFIQAHKTDDPTSFSWISKNEPLSMTPAQGETISEWENNVLCMYFVLNSATKPTPSPEKKKSMPLWMMLKYNVW